jgi:hypothetical protein
MYKNKKGNLEAKYEKMFYGYFNKIALHETHNIFSKVSQRPNYIPYYESFLLDNEFDNVVFLPPLEQTELVKKDITKNFSKIYFEARYGNDVPQTLENKVLFQETEEVFEEIFGTIAMFGIGLMTFNWTLMAFFSSDLTKRKIDKSVENVFGGIGQFFTGTGKGLPGEPNKVMTKTEKMRTMADMYETCKDSTGFNFHSSSVATRLWDKISRDDSIYNYVSCVLNKGLEMYGEMLSAINTTIVDMEKDISPSEKKKIKDFMTNDKIMNADTIVGATSGIKNKKVKDLVYQFKKITKAFDELLHTLSTSNDTIMNDIAKKYHQRFFEMLHKVGHSNKELYDTKFTSKDNKYVEVTEDDIKKAEEQEKEAERHRTEEAKLREMARHGTSVADNMKNPNHWKDDRDRQEKPEFYHTPNQNQVQQQNKPRYF